MTDDRYPLHQRSEVKVVANPYRLFALLGDHRRLAARMEKPSMKMAGATMRVETDALKGQSDGALIRITGRVLGGNLALEEVVTERVPPFRKTWEARGEPPLLVIGAHRMGFAISPEADRSRLLVFINYQLLPRGFARALGLIFGHGYAAWRTWRITADAATHFNSTSDKSA